jgi:hypothetical protein
LIPHVVIQWWVSSARPARDLFWVAIADALGVIGEETVAV